MCPSQSANGDLGAIKSSAADPKSRTTTGLLARIGLPSRRERQENFGRIVNGMASHRIYLSRKECAELQGDLFHEGAGIDTYHHCYAQAKRVYTSTRLVSSRTTFGS
jgi:hypothetical protein